MKSSRLNEWLQILASLGVLIGLFVVAYEIKQNTEIARAEYYRETYNMWMHVSTVEIETGIDEIIVKSIADPESLSPGELFKLNAYFILVTSVYDNGVFPPISHPFLIRYCPLNNLHHQLNPGH